MKQIKLTNKELKQHLHQFQQYLKTLKTTTGKIEYRADFVTKAQQSIKPKIIFTPLAYTKIKELVKSTDTEIGWHCIVDKNGNEYRVTDVILYPQEVTGVTVTTNDTEYAMWLQAFPDEVFYKIRMQGHSHVNMTTSPSGTDRNMYDNILQNLTQDDYYIFIIVNKRDEMYVELHDYAQNLIFEKTDITIELEDVSEWATKEKEKHIKTKPVAVYSTGYKQSKQHSYRSEAERELAWQDYLTKSYGKECLNDAYFSTDKKRKGI